MTLTGLITLNAILGAVVVYGIVWLLGSAIGADRDARKLVSAGDLREEADERRTRIAA